MGWTDERVATLKKLWLEGLSASQIAKQLGGVTRNAVIGKVHRLGLSGRAAPSQPPRPVFKAPARRAPGRRRAPPRAAPDRAAAAVDTARPSRSTGVETPGSATVLTLGAHMCKWPIGDPSSGRVHLLRPPPGEEGPYCNEHARVAYQPAHKKVGKRTDGAELARSLRRYI